MDDARYGGLVPDVLILIMVAALGVLVGAVGVAAFSISQREHASIIAPSPSGEGSAKLSAELSAVLHAIPGITIILDEDDEVLRADAHAHAKGLIHGGELTHPDIISLARRARRAGSHIRRDLQLPRSGMNSEAMLDFEVHAASLPAGRVLIIAEDRTQHRRDATARREFTANVSHELKTPVGAISLLAETIAANPHDHEAIARFAPRLTREARRLGNLVQDIIDLSRLQSPEAPYEPQLTDCRAVINAAIQRQETRAEQHEIALHSPDPARIPPLEVWGNEDLLITAVHNLLDNAVRYSPAGGSVTVSASRDEDWVYIRVADTGIGIPADAQERVFERFYRVDPARSRATGGTGLGLSIVKHIVADHGGSVSVESEEGVGSTFTITIPRADMARAQTSRAHLKGQDLS